MPHKMRLPAEEKVQIVEAYLNGQSGASSIQEKYGIGWSTLRGWVRLYEQCGAIGLAGSNDYIL